MKAKKISKEEYIKLYCRDQRIRNRSSLYVSHEVKRKMKLIALMFRDTHTTTASLVDTILQHHIDSHSELLEKMYSEMVQPEEPKPEEPKPEEPKQVVYSRVIPSDQLDELFKY
ncbi:MAG: DUF3408 domain-containing protein [Rikenellaceae bacterium]